VSTVRLQTIAYTVVTQEDRSCRGACVSRKKNDPYPSQTESHVSSDIEMLSSDIVAEADISSEEGAAIFFLRDVTGIGCAKRGSDGSELEIM